MPRLKKTPAPAPLPPSQSGLHLDRLLSARGLAQRLGVARTTVYRYERNGLLRAVRVAGKVLYTPADVERFIAEHLGPQP